MWLFFRILITKSRVTHLLHCSHLLPWRPPAPCQRCRRRRQRRRRSSSPSPPHSSLSPSHATASLAPPSNLRSSPTEARPLPPAPAPAPPPRIRPTYSSSSTTQPKPPPMPPPTPRESTRRIRSRPRRQYPPSSPVATAAARPCRRTRPTRRDMSIPIRTSLWVLRFGEKDDCFGSIWCCSLCDCWGFAEEAASAAQNAHMREVQALGPWSYDNCGGRSWRVRRRQAVRHCWAATGEAVSLAVWEGAHCETGNQSNSMIFSAM